MSSHFVSPTVRQAFVVGIALFLFSRAADATVPERMAAVFPPKAVAYLEVRDLGQVLQRVRDSQVTQSLLALPQFRELESRPQYRKFQAVRTLVQRQIGMDDWSAIERLVGQHVALGLYPKPGSNQPDFLLVLQAADAEVLAQLRQRIEPVIVLADPHVTITKGLEGVEHFSLRDQLFVAWKGSWLAASNQRTLLDEAVARWHEPKSGGLLDDGPFQAMLQRTDSQPPDRDAQRIMVAYLNMQMLNQATGGRALPQKMDNPLGSLLLSDTLELASRSPFASLSVDAGSHAVRVTASVAATSDLGEGYRAFFPAPEEAGVRKLPQVQHLAGGFTLYRALDDWYTHREQLLEEQVLPGFDKFEAGIANLLPGRDFGSDVLPLLGKRLTLVAAPQSYAHLNGQPGVKLPALAAVVELAKPDEAAAVLELLFQTITALSNIQAGQQGRQPWVMTSQNYHGVQISYAKYLQKPEGDRLGIVFNFLPAAARVDDHFIMSSSLELCQQLVDQMHQPAETFLPARTVNAEVYLDPVADLVAANRELFVGRLVQQGRSHDQAQAELDQLIQLVRRLDWVRLSTVVQPQTHQIQLEGHWK